MGSSRRSKFAEADKAAQKGQLDRAVEIYRKLFESHPDDQAVQQRLGDALARSGREKEAAKLFATLADTYWNNGFRARALAALRRAIRIGGEEPKYSLLLARWTMEHEHPRDARPLLISAAALEIAKDDARDALDAYRELVREFQNDVEAHEAHVRVAGRAGGTTAHAKAHAGHAVCLAASGRHEEALVAFAASIESDSEGLSGLSRSHDLVAVVDGAEGAGATVPEEASSTVHAAWKLLRAEWHIRHARNDESFGILENELAGDEGTPAVVLIRAGEIALSTGEVERALPLADVAGARLDGSRQRRKRFESLLIKMARRAPTLETIRMLADRHDVSLPNAAETASGVIAIEENSEEAVPTPAAPSPPAPKSRPLAAEFQAVVVEAESLLKHGLLDKTRKVLDQLDDASKGTARIRELYGELDRRAAATAGPAATPPSSRSETRSAEGGDDDLLVLFEDDDTGIFSVDEAPAAVADREGIPEEAEGPDFGALRESLSEALVPDSEQDEETRYQMALGLIEMGLADQARPLLEECLASHVRRAEAALSLVPLLVSESEGGEALRIGRETLAAGELPQGLRVTLLAQLAPLAFAEGDQRAAGEFVDELRALDPGHEALEGLSGRLTASRN